MNNVAYKPFINPIKKITSQAHTKPKKLLVAAAAAGGIPPQDPENYLKKPISKKILKAIEIFIKDSNKPNPNSNNINKFNKFNKNI